jgi:hypothetical protein
MRLSDLLGAEVRDEAGRSMGRVHDVRLRRSGIGTAATYELTELVIAPWNLRTRAAHAWGYAEGRAAGPRLIRAALQPGAERSRRVRATEVSSWGPDAITIHATDNPHERDPEIT